MGPFAAAFGPALGKGLGAGLASVGSSLLGGLFGGDDDEYSLGDMKELAKYQSKLQRKNVFGQTKDRYNFFEKKGATITEILGSPASGGGSDSVASTLGNQAQAQAAQKAQLNFQKQQAIADRAVQIRGQNIDLEKTKMATDTQLAATGLSADASRYGADKSAQASIYASNILKQIEDGKLDLASKQFTDIALPAAAQNLQLSIAQTQEAWNKVATSRPEFLKFMKMLSMSPENVKAAFGATALQESLGITDLFDPQQLAKLDYDDRMKVLQVLTGLQSKTAPELQNFFHNILGVGDSVLGAGTFGSPLDLLAPSQ